MRVTAAEAGRGDSIRLTRDPRCCHLLPSLAAWVIHLRKYLSKYTEDTDIVPDSAGCAEVCLAPLHLPTLIL